MSEYTHGEVKAVLAPIMGLAAEDIDDFIVITRGRCENCEHRDGYSTFDSATGLVEFIELMNGALDCRIAAQEADAS